MTYTNYTSSGLSIKATGRDLKLTDKGDLGTTNTGDLSVLWGAPLIEKAILRKLHTPPIGYRRLIRDSNNNLVTVNPDYKNDTYLSLANNQNLVESQVIEALDNIGKQEDRINYKGTVVYPGEQVGELRFVMSYSLKSESELRQLNYTRGIE